MVSVCRGILKVNFGVVCSVLLLLSFKSMAVQTKCVDLLDSSSGSYLKQADGDLVGEIEIGSIGGVPVKVRDVTAHVNPVKMPDKPDITIVSLNDVVEDPKVMIGFGYPNVFLIHPTETGPKRFAAKSLYRQDSVVEDLSARQSVQNGLWVVLPELTKQQEERILEEAEKLQGTRRITCSSAACEVLHNAGFSAGNGASLYQEPKRKKLIPRGNDWPFLLLRTISKHGLKHEDSDVKTDFIKVSPGFVERIFTGNFLATVKTPLRHGQRAFNNLKGKIPGLSYFLAKKDNKLSVVAVDFEQKTRSNVRLPEVQSDRSYDFTITAPSRVGYFLRLFWGEHSIIELTYHENSIVKPTDYLEGVLKEYPDLVPGHMHYEENRKSRLVTALKRTAFNPTTIRSFHRLMSKSRQEFKGERQKDIYDLLPLSTPEAPAKMNIVVTEDSVKVMHMKGYKAWADWFLTKHVLISNYSDKVLFAGEIWKDVDGNVYVNSNSGTYKPSAKQLAQAIRLLEDTFPNIPFKEGDN